MEAKHRITHAVPGCQVHIETRHGKPTEQILNIATEWLADKIILGAHGHNTQHYFAGSVSRKIALRAPCSVEFVKLKSIPAEQQATRKKRSETTPATKK
jgi:nucleotide-binding universal stress UspA family protein